MNVNVLVADDSHLPYAESVCHELYLSSLGNKIGIARRTRNTFGTRSTPARP